MKVDRNPGEAFVCSLVLLMSVGVSGCATRLQVSGALLNAAQSQVLPCISPLSDPAKDSAEKCKPPSADKAAAWRESVGSLGEHATLRLQPGSVVRIHGSTIVDREAIKSAGEVPLQFEYRWRVPLFDEPDTSIAKIDVDFVDFLLLRSSRGAALGKEIEAVQETFASRGSAADREVIVRTAVESMRVTTTGKHVSVSPEQNSEAQRLADHWKKAAQEKRPFFRRDEERSKATMTELVPWSDKRYLDALCSLEVLQGNAVNQRQYISFLVPVDRNGAKALRAIESPFDAWASPGTPAKPPAWTGNGTAVVPAQAAIPWTRIEVLVPVYLNDALEPTLLPSCLTLGALERRLNVKVKTIERARAYANCGANLVDADKYPGTAEAIEWQCLQLASFTLDQKGTIRISVPGPNNPDPIGIVLAPEKLPLTWIAPNDRIVVDRIPGK